MSGGNIHHIDIDAQVPTLTLWEQLHAHDPRAAGRIADLYRGELEQLRHEPESRDYPQLREEIHAALRGEQAHFKAILTDPQVEVLEKACARFLDENAEWRANPPTRPDLEQLSGALVALQNAEIVR